MDAAKGLLVLVAAGVLWVPSAAVGQSGWSGGSTSSSAQAMYDRYGQPIAQRTQTAVSETSSALSDSFNAGVKAAEQSINKWSNQAVNSTSAPAWSGNQSTAPAAPSWPSSQPAVPTTVRSSSPTTVSGGWSSITSVAAPPLLVPNSPMQTSSLVSAFSTASPSGQNYTSVASNETQPLHSVLKDPANASAATTSAANAGQATDWSAGWSGDNKASNQVSIGRQGAGTTTANDPRYGSSTQPGSSWSGSDSWSQNQQPTLGAANGAVSVNRQNAAGNPTSSFAGNNPQSGPTTLPSIPQFTGQQGGQTMNANNPGTGSFSNYNTPGTMPTSAIGMPNQMQGNMGPYGQTLTGKGPTEAPWMPLIASVLTLAGSLAANLYLGVSYLDARQKYQSLVRKTAETFRRVKAVAA